MAENIVVSSTASKEERYSEVLPQLEALIKTETDLIANLANIAAVLKYTMQFFWVGFYINREGELVLGPFQGPVACTRIPFDKGVCGAAFTNSETIIVADVEQFPGHIACSSDSKSEIVVPVFKDDSVIMVLDVDSDQIAAFDQVDKIYLEKLAAVITANL
ncbi:MAG: GAF domain-containing protein [Bacteroidota bacterium]